MAETTEAQIRQIAADIFQMPLAQVTVASSPESIEAWDSMGHLNLVLALESQMGVSLPPEEIEQMKSIGAIVELVQRHLGR